VDSFDISHFTTKKDETAFAIPPFIGSRAGGNLVTFTGYIQ